ncbi:uncharacterized protein LOC105843395 isoform X3 [Hydra vulgaris]|uniref:uncharacterized protein LOC105843395 isoform X3 n=1 Tax=Hydra vulgaris TaxID=6087 RepID=UPI001F5F5D62|nr:uncharacterized protein LOC105843395 isoform X3 [Hydra vulgaris]
MNSLQFCCIIISFNFAFTSFLTELFELNDEQQEKFPNKKLGESIKKVSCLFTKVHIFEKNLNNSKQNGAVDGLVEKELNHYFSKLKNSTEIRTLKSSGIEYKDYPKFVATIQYWIEGTSNGENDIYKKLFLNDHKQENEMFIDSKDAKEKEIEEWVKKNFVKQHTEYNRFSKDQVHNVNKNPLEIQDKRSSLLKITQQRFNKKSRKMGKILQKNNFTELLDNKNQWRQIKGILEQRMNKIAKLIGEK